MKKTHQDIKKVVIAISAVVGLGLVAPSFAAQQSTDPRMKSTSGAKPKMNVTRAGSQKCMSGFKRVNHAYGYLCTSDNTSCSGNFIPENLHVSGKKFGYVCRDPSTLPR